MKKTKLKTSLKKAAKGLWNATPIILGVVLLIGLANAFIAKSAYSRVFTNSIFDPVIGSAIGSILAGNPITSYIIGDELLKSGVILVAVTAFIVAWVTVGIITLPAEAMLLGKRFAIVRNAVSFIFSIIVALITVGILNLI